MDITILNKETMDAMRELAKVNMEFSDAKIKLNTMKGEVQEFLDERDKKDKVRLDKLLKESSELVQEIRDNNAQVTTYFNELKAFSGFLNEFHEAITSISNDFKVDSERFMEFVKREELHLEETRKELHSQMEYISSEKTNIEINKKEIEKEKRLIESRQAQMRSALQVISKRQ